MKTGKTIVIDLILEKGEHTISVDNRAELIREIDDAIVKAYKEGIQNAIHTLFPDHYDYENPLKSAALKALGVDHV